MGLLLLCAKKSCLLEWKMPTAILFGSDDTVSEWGEISAFATRHQATVEILEHAEHYFHTEKQLRVFDVWAGEHLLK